MSLETHALDRLLVSVPVDVGLADGPDELKGGGYQRVTVPAGGWESKAVPGGRQISVTQTFGPWTTPMMFDRLLLFDGDTQVEEIPLDGQFVIPAGVTYTNDTVKTLRSV